MNIVLTGFMGTGKSEVGKLLSERLRWPFYDTDDIIERDIGMKIPEVFARFGENYFRDLEGKAVRLVSLLDKAVIACGGGAVIRKENVDELEKHGIIVCLTASPAVILERTKNTGRPLLAVKEPILKIRELLYVREPYYRRCHLTVDTSTLGAEAVAAKILADPLVASKLQ
jgi:shikimate kinase